MYVVSLPPQLSMNVMMVLTIVLSSVQILGTHLSALVVVGSLLMMTWPHVQVHSYNIFTHNLNSLYLSQNFVDYILFGYSNVFVCLYRY